MPEEQQQVEEISIDQLPAKEYNEAREKGLTHVPKKAAIEEKKPEVSEEPEGKEEEIKTDDKPKVKGGFQKRIDRLVKHNAELETAKEAAERRAAELEARIGKSNGKSEEKPAPKDDSEPKIEDFSTVEEFYRAEARWEVRQELKAQEEAKEKAEEEAYTKEIFDNHNRTISEARAKYEDFEEVVKATDTPWKDGSKADVMASQAFAVAMFESGMGGELLYYLAKHPDELSKMGGLSPAKVQMAVGRIVDKLEDQQGTQEDEGEEEEAEEKPEPKLEKPKIVSKAPPPIKPVGGSNTKSTIPLDKMDPIAYNKARESGRQR